MPGFDAGLPEPRRNRRVPHVLAFQDERRGVHVADIPRAFLRGSADVHSVARVHEPTVFVNEPQEAV
ncbi:hypothetical protein ACFVZ5_30845 [Streptomyces sp. NPDC059570]|uniref:hypothetical protein n=1 Tax=Streptomyces sp. NPDC059570 TaxID=3346870 RepID=UPI0036A61222